MQGHGLLSVSRARACEECSQAHCLPNTAHMGRAFPLISLSHSLFAGANSLFAKVMPRGEVSVRSVGADRHCCRKLDKVPVVFPDSEELRPVLQVWLRAGTRSPEIAMTEK